MPKLKITDLVNSIAQLEKGKFYKYPSSKNEIKITEIVRPEGPIKFVLLKGKDKDEEKTISERMLGIAASVFAEKPNYPIHFDRLFAAGGNTRSAFEALLAHTPNFFICKPKRINPYTGEVEQKLKHIRPYPE
jgi:type II restriction enzyme